MSSREQLLEIIGRYVDGAASREEAQELEAALQADAALRREFLRYLNIDAALGGAAPALRMVPSISQRSIPRRKIVRAWFGWAAAAVAAIVLLLLSLSPERVGSGSHVAKPIATLAAATDAVWADPNVEIALRGGELPPGALRLEAGSAEFHFVDGATVLVCGPAAVRFPERKRVVVEKGRVFCRCPSPESRLSVVTPTTEVVDLGTEFSVDARADQSTRVAVLSGEVQVGKAQPQRLRKGQAAVVRGDGLLAIQPLAPEEFSELLLASPSVSEALQRGENLLRDPGFEHGLQESTWNGTDSNLQAAPGSGRSGGAVRISAHGYAQWPQCRQKLATGEIAGRLVVASAWGAVAADDPLHSRQQAMVKVVFLNAQGRDFAFAMRRFLGPKSTPGRFEEAQVAAYAPPGTYSVQLQLMLQSNLQNSGAVVFDDASLVIADPSPEH